MLITAVDDDQLTPVLSAYEDELMPIVSEDWRPVWARLIRALAVAPDHAERLFPYYEGIWLRNGLGHRLTELVRLAVADQTRCPLCMDIRYPLAMAEMTEDDAQGVDDPDAGRYSPREAAALRFAALYAGDHHAIGEAQFAELREHFDDREIMELLLLCALALGIGRILMVTEMLAPSCPVQRAAGPELSQSAT